MNLRVVNGQEFGPMRAPQPGDAWLCPWIFDPARDDAAAKISAHMALISAGTIRERSYLSKYYWVQWAHIRPPIIVVCPDGTTWCVDARSSSGYGWEVTGLFPNITCTPSIDCRPRGTYHGYLRDGVFTPNLEE